MGSGFNLNNLINEKICWKIYPRTAPLAQEISEA